MRRRTLAAALAALPLGAGCAQPIRSAGAAAPKVDIDHTEVFDRSLALWTGPAVDEAALRELQARIGEFRAAWAAHGPAMLGAAAELVGRPYRFAETRAALVSARVNSMSHPLIVNMRPYLAASAQAVQPHAVFVGVVVHEVLHRYIDDIVQARSDRTTALLRQYAAEPAVVRNHLHLSALERLVARRLGREHEYAQLVAFERTLRSAAQLDRARELVEREGAQRVLDELSGRDGAE